MIGKTDMQRSFAGIALVVALACPSPPARSQPASTRAADPKDPLLESMEQIDKTVESQLDPSSREMMKTLRTMLEKETPKKDDVKDARYGVLETGKRGEGGYDTQEASLRLAIDRDIRILGADHPGTATGLDKLAKRLLLEGRFAEAEPFLRRAAAIDGKVLPDHPRTGEIYCDLARALIGRGEFVEAESLLRRAAAIQEKALGSDSSYLAQTLVTLAALMEQQSRSKEAEQYWRNALAIDERALGAESLRVAEDLEGLGELIIDQSRNREAASLLGRAASIEKSVYGDDDPNTARLEMELGFAAYALSRTDVAVELLRPACRVLVREATNRGTHAATRQRLSAEATACSSGLATFLWHLHHDGGLKSVSADVLREEAFDAAQFSLASSAAESLAHLGARSAAAAAGAGDEAASYEAELERRDQLDIEMAQATSDQSGSGVQALKTLELARDVTSRRIDSAAAALKRAAPRYWDYRSPESVTIAALRARTGDDAVLLHGDEVLILIMLSPGGGEGLVFAVSKDGSAWAKTGLSGAEIATRVQLLRAQIDPQGYRQRGLNRGSPASGAQKSAFDRKAAYDLYQALLGDPAIQSVIASKSTLLFVLSGAMTSLPPALLVTSPPVDSGATGDNQEVLRRTKWLLRDKAIAVLPAVASLRTLRQILPASRTPPVDPLLAFADPDFGSPRDLTRLSDARSAGVSVPATFLQEYPPASLPGTRIEAQALQRGLGAGPGSLLLGPDASKAELMARNSDGRLGRVRVLEFATHAVFSGEIPGLAEPALILAASTNPQDEILTVSEAATLRLNADWVLLSACDTGSPDTPGAPGLSGLSRAFLFAGARSLLVSHWHVRDDITALLIPAVISAGERAPRISRAQALREASLAILDDVSLEAAEPSAWAPFVLLGEPGR